MKNTFKVEELLTFFNGSKYLKTVRFKAETPEEIKQNLLNIIKEDMETNFFHERVEDIYFYGLQQITDMDVYTFLSNKEKDDFILKTYYNTYK
jgi:hypothetical protein